MAKANVVKRTKIEDKLYFKDLEEFDVFEDEVGSIFCKTSNKENKINAFWVSSMVGESLFGYPCSVEFERKVVRVYEELTFIRK